MKIYLASDYARKSELQNCRDTINALGPPYKVVSTWIDKDDLHEVVGDNWSTITEDRTAYHAVLCKGRVPDIRECDLFVLFTDGKLTRGSQHAEFGVALGLEKRIVIVGPRENVFQCCPGIKRFRNWEEFVSDLLREGTSDIEILARSLAARSLRFALLFGHISHEDCPDIGVIAWDKVKGEIATIADEIAKRSDDGTKYDDAYARLAKKAGNVE